MESMGFIKRSQTVMQIGMGGGMKAGVNVWRALRDVQDDHLAWRHLNGVPVTGVHLMVLFGRGGGGQSVRCAKQLVNGM
jgi:hypothetical protein